MTVTLRRGLPPEVQAETIHRVQERLAEVGPRVPGSHAIVGGLETIVEEATSQAEVDLRTGEGIALPVSLVIMLVVFGGFLAAGLPIVGAIASIAGAMATLLGFSYLLTLDVSTVNVVTVLGLGLCIDYGLLLVSRYREEMRLLPGDPTLPPTRRQRELALRRTMDSAGRTVLFSGVTVAVSLSGLMVFKADFLRAIGAAGVSIVVVAMLVALTLVPALLAVVRVRMIRPGITYRIPGLRWIVRKLGDVAPADGVFSRLARGVQRHPALVLITVIAALGVCTLPLLRMHPVISGTALLPKDSEQRQLFEAVQTRFQFAAPPPIQVVVDAPVKEVCPNDQRPANPLGRPAGLPAGARDLDHPRRHPDRGTASAGRRRARLRDDHQRPRRGQRQLAHGAADRPLDPADRHALPDVHGRLRGVPARPHARPAHERAEGDRHRRARDVRAAVPHDRLGAGAVQGPVHERHLARRVPGRAGVGVPGRARRAGARASPPPAAWRWRSHRSRSRSGSGSRWTTRCSCSRGSRSSGARAGATTRPSSWACSGPGASSPRRR
jgi:uncharacterized membrane protein YgcG